MMVMRDDPTAFRILAIDPGLSGAWAVLTRDGDFVEAGDLPRFAGLIDGTQLSTIISLFNPRQGVIERVHSMPKQGVSSAFTFGAAYGLTIGVMTGAGLPISFVTPQKWKSHFRLSGAMKGASVQRAVELYPAASAHLTLKKHHNRADAILLGRYFVNMAT